MAIGTHRLLGQNAAPLLLLILTRIVQSFAEIATLLTLLNEQGIQWIVKLAGEHFVFLALHIGVAGRLR